MLACSVLPSFVWSASCSKCSKESHEFLLHIIVKEHVICSLFQVRKAIFVYQCKQSNGKFFGHRWVTLVIAFSLNIHDTWRHMARAFHFSIFVLNFLLLCWSQYRVSLDLITAKHSCMSRSLRMFPFIDTQLMKSSWRWYPYCLWNDDHD